LSWLAASEFFVEHTIASGRDVTGSGSGIYDKGYYLMIKSYSSIVVVKFTTKVEFY
jgi:hypothetical protein